MHARFAEGRDDRYPSLAVDLVKLPVDVIVTWGTPAALAAKQATTTIPIVMGSLGDPVSVGIVPNLARPGGNITGFAAQNVDLEGKNDVRHCRTQVLARANAQRDQLLAAAGRGAIIAITAAR